jgi:hypothetical protein
MSTTAPIHFSARWRTRQWLALRHSWLALAAAPWIIAGCNVGGPRLVDQTDPAVRIPAMRHAVRSGDLSATARLVDDLESDDPAIRLYAIQALHRLTGHRFGYEYYLDEEQRKGPVAKWRAWLRGEQDEHRADSTDQSGGQTGG